MIKTKKREKTSSSTPRGRSELFSLLSENQGPNAAPPCRASEAAQRVRSRHPLVEDGLLERYRSLRPALLALVADDAALDDLDGLGEEVEFVPLFGFVDRNDKSAPVHVNPHEADE